MVHHSRNTAAKQWDETKVLTLNGITKSFVDFLPVLVDLSDFQKAWRLFLNFIRDWCLDGSPEVSMAAIKSLKTLIRYPKDLAEGQQLSENIATKLLDLWEDNWDTWAGIGIGAILKADENTKDLEMNENSLLISSKASPPIIFHGSVTQETLTVYISLFGDLFEVVRPNFGSPELSRLFLILSLLPLYHTNPQASANGRRLDFVNDTDNLTALQSAILELAAGSSVPVKVVDESTTNKAIDFLHIQGAQEAILSTVASFTRSPFARNSSTEKSFTYIALAKKSMQTLVSFFQVHKSRREIYSSGAYAEILMCLGSAMKEKYDCPAVGQKDSTPLWKSSATSFMTVVKGGLEVIDTHFSSGEFLYNLSQENILNLTNSIK
jgi:hypothetical protein